jgi:hypothetical protein
MSTVTTHPARGTRRAQIVAEAVVSAYIHEIARSERPRERTRARRGCAETPNAVTRSAVAMRTPRRPFALRRRPAVELGARELSTARRRGIVDP